MTSRDDSPIRATAPWWTSAVVYQIYPRSFADSNGDGIGDLAGIRSRLDHLEELGVDVIWLSPIYRSPQFDNGYDISDYEDIDPVFGDLAGFDALLADLHRRGMKLVMDLVVNHTSHLHPWFIESSSSTDNPKRDWYWWRSPRAGEGGPGAPNNWRSFFASSSWTLDETTGEYYLHLFAPQQPDLNWENREVREAVYAMMRRWLDRGVDGFRMDVINFISKDTSLPDGPLEPGAVGGDGSAFYLSGPRIHEFLQEMHREVFAGRDAELITVGETPGVTLEDGRLFTDPARAELDMIFQFEHVSLDRGPGRYEKRALSLPALKQSLARWQDGLGPADDGRERGWNSLYLNNHDQPRLVSRYGDDGRFRRESATLWATILHLHRGTPYVYQGEEIGMTNTTFTAIDDFADLEALNHYREQVELLGADPEAVLEDLRALSRDNARTPVQWDPTEQAGFTTGTPWMAVNPNRSEVNLVDERDAPGSVFRHYQRLIRLRHEDETVRLGDFELLEAAHPTLYAFTRTLGGDRLLVVGNVSGEPLEVPLLERWGDAALIIGNRDGGTGTTLQPWEVRVLRAGR
ncbi:alpha,alpha-phosphotrehalase [Amnibacterium flavum]|uniref:Glucohydrolase n=1 Tax=Amnibacterium flavum TaxID=2173173 RepID=A0A2V1HTA0_9MICO|nr:alpha,alpha-phosphotrehalase [Amnibacterium flavum]PVZ93547.1 glucohydrolase [Amnibacterium flavum]